MGPICPEAAIGGVPWKKVFLEILQNSQAWGLQLS